MRWYFTNLPFLPGETVINNRVFDSDPYLERPVGELPEWSKEYKQDGARPSPSGLTGTHQCHPEWFKTGEPWPTTLPDTVYAPDGIPTCCPPRPVAPVVLEAVCTNPPIIEFGVPTPLVLPPGQISGVCACILPGAPHGPLFKVVTSDYSAPDLVDAAWAHTPDVCTYTGFVFGDFNAAGCLASGQPLPTLNAIRIAVFRFDLSGATVTVLIDDGPC